MLSSKEQLWTSICPCASAGSSMGLPAVVGQAALSTPHFGSILHALSGPRTDLSLPTDSAFLSLNARSRNSPTTRLVYPSASQFVKRTFSSCRPDSTLHRILLARKPVITVTLNRLASISHDLEPRLLAAAWPTAPSSHVQERLRPTGTRTCLSNSSKQSLHLSPSMIPTTS